MIFATYGISNCAGVAITEANDEQVIYIDAIEKKRKAKVYITAKGRAYFKYCSGFRIYLDECMRCEVTNNKQGVEPGKE